MELILTRLSQHHLGWKLVIKNQEDLRHIASINGNDATFLGPVILLNLDQHVIYGLSHPEVISKIFQYGPQCLISTKELSHNLFEHGMKAALGKIKLNMNYFTTNLDTFYTVTNKAANLTLITSKENQLGCLIQPRTDLKPILISNYTFIPKDSDKELLEDVFSIAIEDIKTHIITEFKPYGYTKSK